MIFSVKIDSWKLFIILVGSLITLAISFIWNQFISLRSIFILWAIVILFVFFFLRWYLRIFKTNTLCISILFGTKDACNKKNDYVHHKVCYKNNDFRKDKEMEVVFDIEEALLLIDSVSDMSMSNH
jgi:hypothetical protein